MAAYRTCLNCAHAPNECATRDRIKQAIAGLSVTYLKFRCPDRAPIYRVGERVSVTWPVCVEAGYCDHPGDWNLETWPATVIKEIGSKFLICVDDVDSDLETPARSYIQNENLYCKVSASRLARLDEPKRAVCGLCGLVEGAGFDACWQIGTVRDRRCLAEIQEQPPLPPRHADDLP